MGTRAHAHRKTYGFRSAWLQNTVPAHKSGHPKIETPSTRREPAGPTPLEAGQGQGCQAGGGAEGGCRRAWLWEGWLWEGWPLEGWLGEVLWRGGRGTAVGRQREAI